MRGVTMSFRVDGPRIISDVTRLEYRVSLSFHRVLRTLPTDAVPKGVVMLGVLSEQLEPLEEDVGEHIDHVESSVSSVPTGVVPSETVEAILWLLHQVKSTLASEQKETIGEVIEAAELNTSGDTAPDEKLSVSADSDGQSHLTVAAVASEEHFRCEFCSQPFEFEGQLTSHWMHCDDRPSGEYFDCPHCQNRFIAEYARTQHLQSCSQIVDESASQASETTNNVCEGCGEQFKSRRQLQAHEFTCSPGEAESSAGSKVLVRDAVGTVTHYSTDGYGFISTTDLEGVDHPDADRSEDVFFHISDYPGREPSEGDLLEFNIITTEKGFNATEISKRPRRQRDDWDETFASTRPQWSKDT